MYRVSSWDVKPNSLIDNRFLLNCMLVMGKQCSNYRITWSKKALRDLDGSIWGKDKEEKVGWRQFSIWRAFEIC